MKNKPLFHFGRLILAGMVLILLGLTILPRGLGSTAAAASEVEKAWQNVYLSTRYTFAADIVIKTIPLPTTGNVGRFSRTNSLYLEGVNDRAGNSLEMALWGDGVSVTDRAAAYQVRVRNGRTETRAGGAEWQAGDNNITALAPDGDFLVFLDVAQNVTLADSAACAALGHAPRSANTTQEASVFSAPSAVEWSPGAAGDCNQLMVYTFDLNSRAYAEKLRSITERQMLRSGQLPAGASLQIPQHLTNIAGAGELWVDSRGLPVRQKVTMAIPAAAGSDNRSEVVMDIHFSDYQGYSNKLAVAPWLQPLARRVARLDLPSTSELGGNLALFSLILVALAVLVRPGRRTRLITTWGMLIAIVFTPSLQVHASSQAVTRASAQQAAVEQAQSLEQNAQAIQDSVRAAGPYTPPAAALNLLASASLSSVAPAAANTSLDSDGDGLTDAVEDLIGSSPFSKDSDLDGISDYNEVVGFVYGGKIWYGNPLWADSNMDDKIDSVEWNPAAPDSDGDGTPDLYDFDDDGDGVPDDVDISSLVASKDNGGALVTFSEANPLNLTVSGLQANRYTNVSVQIRPTNPDHLWYAFNVLNWPKDEKGAMQDWDGKTFFDHCVATGGVNCKMTPDANGDIKLIPMLEVAVSDLSNLPRTAAGALDRGLLDKYSISVQPAGNGGYFLYAPLNLVKDKTTGQKVAFNAQLLYQTGATWQPQQARLSWGVQVLREQYASAHEAKKVLNAGSGMGANQATFLHAYYDDFHLTGLNVREDRGVQMAIVYEDPATDSDVMEDDALLHMMTGLGNSYLINRDCDFVDNQGQCVGDGQRDITIPVIKQRWDRMVNSGITEGQRWGIPANRLRVETYSYTHEDEATMIGGGTHAPAILNAHFTNTAATKPSLLFVRESRFRAANLDSRAGSAGAVVWSGQAISMTFNGVNEVITGGYNLAPYRYDSGAGWVRQTPQEAVAEVERRYPLTADTANNVPSVTLGQQVSVVMVTSNAMEGTQGVLSQNGPAGLTAAFSSGIRFSGFDISDESMRNTYVQALTAAGRAATFLAVGFMRNATTLSETQWNKLVDLIFYKNNIGNIPQDFDLDLGLLKSKLTIERIGVQQNIALVQFWTGVGALLGAGIGLALTNLNNKGAQTAGQIVLATVTAVQSTVSAVTMFQQIANNVRTLGELSEATVMTFTLGFRYALNSAFAKASAVGAAIGGVVTWALFFAAWGKGGLSTDSVEFNNLLAGAVAGTLLIVVTIFLSLTVVGAIILAVFAVFDLIALIICKAGVKAACSLGITEALTKLITEWIYTGGVMIDTKFDPAITNIKDADMRLTHPERGLVVGNGVRFVVDLWTYVRHATPEPGIIYHYDNFFTAEDLGSTTVRYELSNFERKTPANLNQTQWGDVVPYGWVEAEVPSPVVGWLVPTTQSKTLYRSARSDQLTSGVYTFDSAKINQAFPLYLNTGLALPRYDCWFQVCVHKSAKSSVSTNLGKSFILDILPATLDGFVAWSELGAQKDRDGDGVPAGIDPDDTKWDTDGDGAPDGKELDYGSNPRLADADGDGLNDALEMRYGTHPRQADTDGDGISDFNEVNGYALIFGDRSVHITSDPLNRDGDSDGISDGAERRLNLLDPARYPFHPGVYNEPPVRTFTAQDDLDRVLAGGGSTPVTTTVINGTAAENSLLSSGRFTATLPSQLGGASQSSAFTLLPTTSKSIVLQGTAADANGVFSITTGVAADLHPVGVAQSGAFDDIIVDDPIPVTIDKDQPDEPQLTLGQFVQPGNTVIIGGTASDPTSYVSLVDVAVGGGTPNPATGTSLWAFPVDIPNTPTGNVPITVRAFDAVSNTRSVNFALTIDGVPPVLTTDLTAGALRQVRRNAAGEWTLRLTGTATDALAGMASLTFQIGTSSNVVITPTGVMTGGIAANGAWLLDYPFDDPSFTADPSPTGAYTATLTARDTALPDGNPTTLVIPFVIDMTPPVVELLSHKDEMQLTDGAVITGTVQDAHAPVASVDFAFVDAATVFESAETLLNLPLNDLPGTLLFNNNAMAQTRIFCLDESCPTSGVPGEDGTAAQVDGQDDMLRAFETLELPESGLTTSLWFKTTNPNAGLFSAVQGVYPALTGHDREIFLVTGKVCASVLVGALREVRCSAAETYADGQWHQAVHSLGSGGNALYVDGRLAASSPTTASTFTGQDRVLVGYAPTAAAPFLNGALDNVVIYNNALSARSVATLYRQWQPAALSGNQWSFTVPARLEGYYQIDMRATDSVGNRVESRGNWPQFRGPVDTQFPTFAVSAAYRGSGSSSQTLYGAEVRDANLTTTNYDFVCALADAQLRYEASAAQLAFTGQPSSQLSALVAQCTRAGFQTSLVAASACDTAGHCGAATPPQSVAYIGATDNRVQPFGSLPNAIERVNLSDPGNRVRLIERPGRQIVDIAVDELHGKLYWAEIMEGPGGQPAGVWRANLDGSGVQQVVSGLTAYAAEALQIALDPIGNKLYWTKGYELWWANLDGTLPQAVYSIPPDPGYVGGALELMGIGDVTVDRANGRLYLSERRLRGNLADYNAGIRNFGQTQAHTLIVTTNLNGQSPEFFAGVGAGCTYANYYDNLGYGVGAGQDPTLCLTSGTDGFDVEAMTVSSSTLYWSAIDADKVNSGIYGRTPGQSAFRIAPLALPGNTGGLRIGPLPQLHVESAGGVFVQLPGEGWDAGQIVRGETGGEFTVFTSFLDSTPPAPGNARRSSSKLSAPAVVVTAQETQTDADLAVGLTSPDLVVVNGGTVRYDIAVRNDAALAADNTVLALALPEGASYAGASQACTSAGDTVTCNLGRFAALTQQSLAISLTIATATVRDLTATVSVAAATAERNPADNTASHTGITAAPTLAALPGIPYIYYGNLTHLTRVPLFGDYTAEPLFMDPPVSGEMLAADLTRNRLYLITALDNLIAVNPDSSGRVEVAANVNPVGTDSTGRLHVAVNDATGRVYWSQIKSLYLTEIKSANPDGSDVQTVVSDVRNQRGLLVDPIRRKLYWVGSDIWLRQELIFRSNLDGSNMEVVYSAPEGKQMRALALDPYSQKLYWLDPTTDYGTLFWADADGGRLATLASWLGSDARGLVVRPAEDALYYVSNSDLVRAKLDGSDPTVLADLNQRAYTGLRLPVAPTTFAPTYIVRPSGNLAFVIATPFATPPCVTNDSHEPNNSAATAAALAVGSTTGALCTTDAALPQDIDFYTVTVPNGQQLNLTLGDLPADYGLYVQRAGQTVATSLNAGLANETIAQPNYEGDGSYTVVVFSGSPVNNPAPYTLDASLTAAPPQTVFSNAQCLAVDPNDQPGLAGNYSQGQATPLTVGTVITGALCYQFDVDFFAFDAVAGQTLNFDLPVRPAAYELHIYRPNGTFFNAFNPSGFGAPVHIDTTGRWAVAVRIPNLTPTLSTYQLLVSDGTCGLNDSWEPNNTTERAAELGATNRVNATLCAADDVDNYKLTAAAGQRLTINYPANAAGAMLRVLNPAGAEVGRVPSGSQGVFTLAAAGDYTLVAANGSLGVNDAPYMFQWLLDAPQPVAADTEYVYYGDFPHLTRVALSADHTVETLFVEGGSSPAGGRMAADPTRGKLYFVESAGSQALVSLDFDGRNLTVIAADVNPDNVSTLDFSVALDELGGRIFWTQPYGGQFSTAAKIMRSNLDGSGPVQIKSIIEQHGLLVDQVQGHLYWVAGNAIYRSDLNGNGQITVRAAVAGQQVRDLSLDPLARQLTWIDPQPQRILRLSLLDASETVLISSLSADARGVVLRPERNEMYYSSGAALLRASLDGSSPVQIAALSGAYQGPSNLDPNAFQNTPIGSPDTNLVLGRGAPILSPCAVADGNEPNNAAGSATALAVVTTTVTYGALCNATIGQPTDTDYYSMTVPVSKTLTATLTELPADYRLVIIHPAGYAAAFSENPGLADESGVISNTSGSPVVYTVLVLSGSPVQNTNRYKLTLTLGDVPPPPDPDDAQCYAVDSHDAPGVGNGTLATATALSLGAPMAAALCYSNDVDMYAFDGLNGQTITLDLPTRPQDYELTLYDPAGAVSAVISPTTVLTYGVPIQLAASGRYTVSVSQPNLTPTTDQYQLLVTDRNCIASDANEPNNAAAFATPLNNGSRVRATLCGSSDVDLYRVTATAGQELTLNYPANATGAAARILPAAGGDLGQVTAGGQGVFTIPANGDYLVWVENGGLAGSAVPYLFELLLGAPTTPPAGSPYVYYSRVSDLIRADVANGTVEPILLPSGFVGGEVLANDTVRSKLYILDNFERVVQVNPDGSDPRVVVADTGPGVLRFTRSLVVDERSGRIYWTQATFGVVSNILSANGDGSDVQTVVNDVVGDEGLAVDPVGGRLYWVQNTLYNNVIVDHVRRANLDGTDAQTIYAAPEGREIRELTVDPFAQMLYWSDPTQNRLLRAPADGSGAVATVVDQSDPHGFVVRPLAGELYFTADSQLWRAALDGSSPVALARLDGAYNGVSNLDINVFYPTIITPPGSNLALAFSAPYAPSCATVDGYEPNNTLATAAAITPGSLSAALCTDNLANPDDYDFYTLTVADGKQITATLTNLPQDYGLVLLANGGGVAWGYAPGTADETLTHINRTGAPVAYTVMALRNAAMSARLPYTLNVTVTDAPPPPPPPPPPPDACAPFDPYDAPGFAGNQTRDTATLITYNTPITAALCYTGDKDAYAFDGVVGQSVKIDLSPRPADYLITLYDPDGQYVTGIFPGSWLNYGDRFTLNATGRWTLIVWDPYLAPTTSQYQLLLSMNTACFGLDPYEPNSLEFAHAVITRTLTLRAMLCEVEDQDSFSFPVAVGDRVRINPRILSDGVNGNGETMNMNVVIGSPDFGFGEISEPYETIVRSSGDFSLGIYTQPRVTENLPYEIDVEIIAPPPTTPTPNNWSCTTYPSSNVPLTFEDFSTLASTVNVPVSGAVTHVGLRDITFNHNALWNVSFGLAAPDGTLADLFAFADYDFYVWCGNDGSGNPTNCRLSLDDGAIEGLWPPPFPNNGGTFRPSRSSLAAFDGKASSGTWTLFMSDNEPGSGEGSPEPADLFSWALEVCVDNGNPPNPTPTPTPTPTQAPEPGDGSPPSATSTPIAVPTPTPVACTPTSDSFEDDDTYQTASLFNIGAGSSAGHNFDSPVDSDWYTATLVAGLEYTLNAVTANPAQRVALALYDTNGTTLLDTHPDQLVLTPAISGRYYVRAISGSGLGASPCDSTYSLVLTSHNPNAAPVPPPTGAPMPPGHSVPPLSAAMHMPASHTAFTQTQPITIQVGLNAENTVHSAELFANGSSISLYPPPPLNAALTTNGLTAPASVGDLVWQTTWTPAQSGVYSLTVVITDSANLTATSQVNLLYVDLADPSVTLAAETITTAKLDSSGAYLLQGTASDDSEIDKVDVRLGGGPWHEAVLNGSAWAFTVAPLAQTNPDGGTLAIEVRATDKAGRTATAAANVLLDVVPPAPFISTTSLTSGAVISPSQVISDLGVRIAWPAINGAAAIYAGYTAALTPTLGSLTSQGAGAGALDQTVAQGSILYSHVIAVDSNGNERADRRGPFYFDAAQTPDLIADLALENWGDSGGKQVGQMISADHGVQKLFAGWNADALRLRWQGFNLDGAGDLYLYLGTGGSGTTDLYNPYGPGQSGVLPFAADYVVRLTGGVTPTLLSFTGGAWVQQGPVAALISGELTDVLLPFTDLGITVPAVASLKLLGVATAAGASDVWATVPDQNLGRTWNQYIQFASLAAGIVPADGVWADTLLDVVTITSEPSPADLLGAGDNVTVTLLVRNVGSAILPGLALNGTTTGGFSLSNAPQAASNLAPTATISLTLNGAVTASGGVALRLSDSFHRPYELRTLAYTVDSSAPISVSLAITTVKPFSNTLVGFAADESPLGLFEVEITGAAGTQIISCPLIGINIGAVTCPWNAGSLADGATLTLRARAADMHGNLSGWSDAIPVTVDATPPQLVFSTAALAALADGWLNASELTISGTLTDDRAIAQIQLCTGVAAVGCTVQDVLPDGAWTVSAPDLGDAMTTTVAFAGAGPTGKASPDQEEVVTTTLTWSGFDLAGNASQLLTETVVIDTAPPAFGLTNLSQGLVMSGTAALLGSGTVTDGGGVSSVQVYVVKPDGSSAAVTATLSSANASAHSTAPSQGSATWSAQFVFDQTGDYQVLVTAADTAGNKSAQFAGVLDVADPLAAVLSDFSAVQQGEAILVAWETVSEMGNIGFNLYRGPSVAGPDRQLNQALIPSAAPGSSGGFLYTWLDHANLTPGMIYYYWVEDVDISGVTTRHGPVSAYYSTPTSLRLSALAAGAAIPPVGLWGVGALLILLAAAFILRRRPRSQSNP